MWTIFPPLFLAALHATAQTTALPSGEQATGSISGTVRDTNTGTPIAAIEVYANRFMRDTVKALTDAEGRYTLRGVKPGKKSIAAVAPAGSGMGPGPAATRIVTLVSGQDVSGIDFKLSNHAVLSGRILDENKEPLPDISVLLIAREYSLGTLRHVYASMATTDDRGEYTLNRVPAGRISLNGPEAALETRRYFRIAVRSEGEKVSPRPYVLSRHPIYRRAEALVLRPGERRENVDIRMRRAPCCIEGSGQATGGAEALRFQISDRQPTSGASGDGDMFVMPPSGITGADGKMRICELPPGEYQLAVQPVVTEGAPSFYGTAAISIGDRDADKILVKALPAVPLSGEVVWVGEAPEPPVTTQLTIVLRPLTRAQWQGETSSVRTSIPVQFSFKHVLVDEYGVQTFDIPAGSYIKDTTYGGRSVMREPLNVGSAVGDVGLKIALARDGGTVAANVVDREGKPVANTHVLILPLSVNSEAALAASMVSGQTDQNGVWSSAPLSPGKYHVLASPHAVDRSPESIAKLWRARLRAQEVELLPNQTSQVRLVLTTID